MAAGSMEPVGDSAKSPARRRFIKVGLAASAVPAILTIKSRPAFAQAQCAVGYHVVSVKPGGQAICSRNPA